MLITTTIFMLIGSALIGVGTNWMVGVGAGIICVSFMYSFSTWFETMGNNMVKVNNNLASNKPHSMKMTGD